jgi:hypothetical protein
MKLNKRFFLITTMAVVIFAAIALAPRFTRIPKKVHAVINTYDVALIVCDRDGSEIQVLNVTSTDSSTTLPAIGSDCGKGIALLQLQGFGGNTAYPPFPTSIYQTVGVAPLLGSITTNQYPLWTLCRYTYVQPS